MCLVSVLWYYAYVATTTYALFAYNLAVIVAECSTGHPKIRLSPHYKLSSHRSGLHFSHTKPTHSSSRPTIKSSLHNIPLMAHHMVKFTLHKPSPLTQTHSLSILLPLNLSSPRRHRHTSPHRSHSPHTLLPFHPRPSTTMRTLPHSTFNPAYPPLMPLIQLSPSHPIHPASPQLLTPGRILIP